MIYIGIDPGQKGGIAILYDNGLLLTEPYSDTALLETCADLKDTQCICCLERVHSMPNQGVASTFKFGAGYGFIKGVLSACGIPYQEILPQRWKKEFGLNSDKMQSIEVCRSIFPNVNLKRTERCKVNHDGMAEAALMAEYARRKL